MSDFTPEEIKAICEAVALDRATGQQRLTELFGDPAGGTTLRLTRAAELVDRIRAGESVDLGDGTTFARDVGDPGGVLGEVHR